MQKSQLISDQLGLRKPQVEATLKLLSEKATIPFISRYRKDLTGGLDEVQIEKILELSDRFDLVEAKKQKVLKNLEERGLLTDDLKRELEGLETVTQIDDFYLPYKERKQTKFDIAIKAGLASLAKIVMSNGTVSDGQLQRYVSKDFESIEKVEEGVYAICANWIAERKGIRNGMRRLFWSKATIASSLKKGAEDEGEKYRDYYDFEEQVKRTKPHRFFALMRGESEGILKVSITPERKEALEFIKNYIGRGASVGDQLDKACREAYSKSLRPSMENEVKAELKEKASKEGIRIFGENLRQLLLQPPLGSKRILAIDPGFRSGCKLVTLDEQGQLLGNATIYPHPPQNKSADALRKLATMIDQYKVDAIAVGNGTASRETERLLKQLKTKKDVVVFIVNEAGASVYSASKVGRAEFPSFDVTVRGAVSIGRRLMDPIAELVKIDPWSIGVGQYQHDLNQNDLKKNLGIVVESCVNKVGVELNTASSYLLQYISGIGPQLAENIVSYRNENGPFSSRSELLKVPKLGQKAYEQASGFLRIKDAKNPLDNSGVHPENYGHISELVGKNELEGVIGDKDKVEDLDWSSLESKLGKFTLEDLKKELASPTRDVRKGIKKLEFSAGIKTLDDVKIGMELPGIVNNLTNFGAFVDIGIKENGLIHVSNMADKFVSDPTEILSLHQHVKVEVISIDAPRKRLGLKYLP